MWREAEWQASRDQLVERRMLVSVCLLEVSRLFLYCMVAYLVALLISSANDSRGAAASPVSIISTLRSARLHNSCRKNSEEVKVEHAQKPRVKGRRL